MERQGVHPTVSQQDQQKVQAQVFHIYNFFSELPRSAQSLMLEIQREKHLEYLNNGLRQLGPSFVVLDASRPWLCYWILHSIALLGDSVDYATEANTIDFINRCQNSDGGFGGGPGQISHLATTYAAVSALVTLGGHNAYASINRSKLYQFLRRMKHSSGGFRMHENGEIDVRACYTAISVASILNIMDDELIKNVDDYIVSCQTFEGGIAGEPGSEAHGGYVPFSLYENLHDFWPLHSYTYCGLASMMLIGKANELNLPKLTDWAAFRQGQECGFQGRTNKLVDGCYSFWQGGVLDLIKDLYINGDDKQSVHSSDEPEIAVKDPLFHHSALQQYILLCSQVPDGGFRDKPGKSRDFYHTCYCLSGLSLSQHSCSRGEVSAPPARAVVGPYSNLLEPVHPLFNVTLHKYHQARQYFSSLPTQPL